MREKDNEGQLPIGMPKSKDTEACLKS